mgnify:CR=1 FL=1|jgi:hypothetical protein
MSVSILEPAELRTRGFEALVRALGWVNAVRFIQQYEHSDRNYTAERADLLPDWDAAEIVRRMQALNPGPPA